MKKYLTVAMSFPILLAVSAQDSFSQVHPTRSACVFQKIHAPNEALMDRFFSDHLEYMSYINADVVELEEAEVLKFMRGLLDTSYPLIKMYRNNRVYFSSNFQSRINNDFESVMRFVEQWAGGEVNTTGRAAPYLQEVERLVFIAFEISQYVEHESSKPCLR